MLLNAKSAYFSWRVEGLPNSLDAGLTLLLRNLRLGISNLLINPQFAKKKKTAAIAGFCGPLPWEHSAAHLLRGSEESRRTSKLGRLAFLYSSRSCGRLLMLSVWALSLSWEFLATIKTGEPFSGGSLIYSL